MRDRECQQEDCDRKERHPKSKVWRPKEKADEVEATSVNMVFILPMGFKAPSDEDIEQVVVQLPLDLVPSTFEKPEDKERKHLRPFLFKGYVNGKPMTKMLALQEMW